MIEGCIYIEGRYVHKFPILPKQIYLATRDINYLSFMMAGNGFMIGLLYHIYVNRSYVLLSLFINEMETVDGYNSIGIWIRIRYISKTVTEIQGKRCNR